MSDQAQGIFDVFDEDPQGGRREFDRYLTPSWAVKALLKRLGDLRGWRVIEPCVGSHHIASHFDQAVLTTNDLDDRCRADFHLNAADPYSWRTLIQWPRDERTLTCTNPPFDQAADIVRAALKFSDVVIMLLRITFLEPTDDRGPLLARMPPTTQITLPRFPFRGTTTDSVPCCWFIWDRDQVLTLGPRIQVVDKEEMRALITAEERAAWERP